MSTHTAIAATAKGQFDAIQVPTHPPVEGEVLIKVEYAAMIAFDTYVVDRGFYVQSYPMTLGFSASGTVAELGSGVNDLKVGERVGIWLNAIVKVQTKHWPGYFVRFWRIAQ